VRVASGIAASDRADPELAAEAVRMALAEAGLQRADQVILLLTRDFSRLAQETVVAAARAAGCLQICGSTASGLMTERGWEIDRPAAAALVIEAPTNADVPDAPSLSFIGQSRLPIDWQLGTARYGLLDSNATTWSHGRVDRDALSQTTLHGLRASAAHSFGLRPLGNPFVVDASEGYGLVRCSGQSAADSLRRALPAELRQHPPLHQLCLLRNGGDPGIALLALNADASLTLSEAVVPGETLSWAIRQPLGAEQEMRQSLNAAVDRLKHPDFALVFSCIGRGPLFYGNDDRDLQALRDRLPGIPLIGAYGTGQIAHHPTGNRLYNNSVLTLLFESTHV